MFETTSPQLVLVDGSSYLYRAFHALPSLMTSTGLPTGAAKGVINMLRRLRKDYPQSRIAVVFDAKGKTFRDDIYPEYKANRPPMPDDLRLQIEPIHAIIRAMGLPLLCVEGVEADDVIGTLAVHATAAGWHTLISTGDKDMAQLVGPTVSLVNTMTDTLMDRQGVLDKYGVPPEHIIDLLALMGDSVDNIPGVPGVGEKTALGLVQGLGSLDAIYQRLDEVANLAVRGAKTLAVKLAEEEEKARLSYRLATIKTDLELAIEIESLHSQSADNAALLELYRTLEFKSWISELEADTSVLLAPIKPALEVEYEIVLGEQQLAGWIQQLQAADEFAFDTETTSLNYMEARVVGVSFAVQPGKAAYVPFGHDYIDAPVQLTEQQVLGALKGLLENPDARKIGQHLKYDKNVLANHGINLKGIASDTMLESYVLDATATRHDMDSLALKYLGRSTIHFEDIAGKGSKQITFNQIPLEQAGPYAAEDADVTLQLHHCLYLMLAAEPSLKSVLIDIEIPLIPVLSRMERNGALIDSRLLAEQSMQLGERMVVLEREAYVAAGQEFNLGSPKQLGEILFEKLALPVIKKTPTGAPSTAEEVLQELALDYPLPHLILEYRSLAKLKSTYTDKLPGMVSPVSGRIHTSYHQAVAATGRLSSADPNLQNIPIRTAEGRRIRQAFIAPPGYRMIAADYSQIELRIMAHLSGDEGLLKAFAAGLDIHSATAAEVFGVSLEQVSTDQRRSAKAINFGLIYGMSAFGLARQLKLGRQQAQQYIDLYFERYPGVATYMESTRKLAADKGYVETLYGRRLYLPEINARNGNRRQAAERTAINAPMQGTAADIIKRAMISVDSWLETNMIDARMIMQVHDELVFEVADAAVSEFKPKLRQLMVAAANLAVPMLVDVGEGRNWDEAH